MDEKLDLIVAELKKTAGNEELEVLKKYIEFWNPMEFVTQKDIDRILNRKIQDIQHQLSNTNEEKREIKQTQVIKKTND